MIAVVNIFITLACLLLFNTFFAVKDEMSFTNSIDSLFLFILIYYILYKRSAQVWEKRKIIITFSCGTFLALLYAFGSALDTFATIEFSNVFLWISIIAYGYIASLLIGFAYDALSAFQKKLNTEKSQSSHKIIEKIRYVEVALFTHRWALFALIFLLWLPVYLAFFPGKFNYDATDQFNQLANGYNENFPKLHTVIINGILYLAHEATGSYNVGIAIFTILQMLLLALSFSEILIWFYRQKLNQHFVFFLFLYYSLFPVIHILVTTTVRDIMFAGFLNYAIFLLYIMVAHKDLFWQTSSKWLLFPFIFDLAILARNNNTSLLMVVLLIVLAGVTIFFPGKKHIKKSLTASAIMISFYFIMAAFLDWYCRPVIAKPNSLVANTILLQGVSRAYHYNILTPSEQSLVLKYTDKMRPYVPNNGDPAKISFLGKRGLNNTKNILKMAKEFRASYPSVFLNAYLANSEGVWFPGTILDGYNRAGIYKSYDKCYFYSALSLAKPGTIKSLIPGLAGWYEKIGLYYSFEKIPLISLFFSPAFYLWLTIFSLGYLLWRKRYIFITPAVCCLIYIFVCSFVPIIILRYLAAVFFMVPLLLGAVFEHNEDLPLAEECPSQEFQQ